MTDNYILTLKKQGKSDEFIAAKMGISVEQVNKRWEAIKKLAKEKSQNGVEDLRSVQLMMVNQFQLLGHAMGVFGNAINNSPEVSELQKAIQECPKDVDLAVHLLQRYIIINPFYLPSPQQVLEETERQSQAPSQN